MQISSKTRNRLLSIVLGTIGLLGGTGVANAACFTSAKLAQIQTHAAPRAQSARDFPVQSSAQDDQSEGSPSIVGLWHVSYLLDGQPFYVALDMWHSDGTEFENSYSTPVAGNICMGVWKKTGVRTVQLTHIGWNFDLAGNPAGYFTLTEFETLSAKGDSYTGTFVYNIYDDSGKLQQTFGGTQSATRITP
jgi:hypothetical protein